MQIPMLSTNKISGYADYKQNNPQFRHLHHKDESGYKPSEKVIIAGASILGVLASLAVLAKCAKYSLKPSKMFKDIKNSYLSKVDFQAPEIIAMGVGSCAGGLLGGFAVDKNKQNRKAKLRESVMQIGNVSIPILTVDLLVDKIFKKQSKWIRAFIGLGGVAIGVVLANVIMNKLNNWLFNEKEGRSRKIKALDFSVHLDDYVAAASYISKSDIVHAIGRLVPVALIIPGLEAGKKTADKL